MAKSKADLIKEAVKLLDAGTLASNLAGQLMNKFNLTASRARDIAQTALKQHQKKG